MKHRKRAGIKKQQHQWNHIKRDNKHEIEFQKRDVCDGKYLKKIMAKILQI